jgi:hypothetical protein
LWGPIHTREISSGDAIRGLIEANWCADNPANRWTTGGEMIDLDKLSALEKAAKRGPWYAWLKPVHTPDKCITTVPAEQFLREYKEAEKFNAELSERIGHAAVSDEWKNRYLTYDEEVIGCSEWLHAENADLLLIVEMRNQLPDLLARIADLEKRNAELEAWLGKEQEVKRDD